MPGKRRRSPDFCWETAFRFEVYATPRARRADLLAWFLDWRRRRTRVFWVLDDEGQWRILA